MHQLTIVVGRRTHDLKIRTWQANIVVSFCAIVYATRHAVSRRSSALTAVSECVGSALDCNRSSSVHLKAMTSRANARVVSVIAMIERMAGCKLKNNLSQRQRGTFGDIQQSKDRLKFGFGAEDNDLNCFGKFCFWPNIDICHLVKIRFSA